MDELEIGHGRFARVYKTVYREERAARKRVKELSEMHQNSQERFDRMREHETDIMRSLNHKNIIQFYASDDDDESILMEWAELGSLDNHMYQELLSVPICLHVMRDVAEGMEYLHEKKKMIHGDLRPGNVLLDCFLRAKICDFASAQMNDSISEDVRSVDFHAAFVAPERPQQLTRESDIFSFAMLAWELVCRRRAFDNKEENPHIIRSCISQSNRPESKPFLSSLKNFVLPVANKMKEHLDRWWHQDPQQRGNFTSIVPVLSEAIRSVNVGDQEQAVDDFVADCRRKGKIAMNFARLPNLEKLEAGDFLIIHVDQDTDVADNLKQLISSHALLREIKETDGQFRSIQEEEIIVHTLGEYNKVGEGLLESFEEVYEQHETYLVILSENLNADTYDAIVKKNVYTALVAAVKDDDKKSSVVPVHTKPRGPTRTYKTPRSLDNLRAVEDMEFHQKHDCNNFLRKVNERITFRKNKEKKLEKQRKETALVESENNFRLQTTS